MKKVAMDELEIAQEAFSVLGEFPTEFENTNFKAYIISNWETPSFSAISLIPGRNLMADDLKCIEDYFEKYPQ